MKSTTIQLDHGSPLKLTTFTKPTPLAIRFILGFIAALAFASPVIVLIVTLISGGFKAGILVSFIIMWSIGIYLTRMVLWNTFGKEILELQDNKLNYYCDYEYFQGNRTSIGIDQLQIEMIQVSEIEQTSKLLFKNGPEQIEMVLPIPELELIPIKERLVQILKRS
jgi:hypothetical protein